jgi:hypothetical protein
VVATGVAAKCADEGVEGGLNLFKWNHLTSTRPSGWRPGDYMLHLPNQGSAKLNWAQNSSRLRSVMRSGKPIYESYVDSKGNLIPTRASSMRSAMSSSTVDGVTTLECGRGSHRDPG